MSMAGQNGRIDGPRRCPANRRKRVVRSWTKLRQGSQYTDLVSCPRPTPGQHQGTLARAVSFQRCHSFIVTIFRALPPLAAARTSLGEESEWYTTATIKVAAVTNFALFVTAGATKDRTAQEHPVMTRTIAPEAPPLDDRANRLRQAIEAVNGILLGKEESVRLAFSCLLARGHLLIEDLPGVGKTTLAHALAAVTGARYQRIQFTSDLLPADIVGVSIYRRDQETFEFHPGPIFAELVLADEVNRATPKTQSALLEAMAEGQVTVEGTTRALPEPFFVVATQNPLDLVGTFPLPDSQLDRFLLSISLGFPDPRVERQLLTSEDRKLLLSKTRAVFDTSDILRLQADCERVHVSDALLDYVQALLAETRNSRWFETGLSPRAGIVLLRCARSYAFINDRNFATPADIQAVFPALARHRMTVSHGMEASVEEQITSMLRQVEIP